MRSVTRLPVSAGTVDVQVRASSALSEGAYSLFAKHWNGSNPTGTCSSAGVGVCV